MKVGYARVSSYGQSLEIQLEQLKKAGCEKVFSEKISGTSKQNRYQLKECINFCREGDALLITKLDRLARSMSDLCSIIASLKEKGVDVNVLNNNAIDTASSSGKLMLNILGSIAEFETELRKERQAEGIKKALDKGIKFGRKKNLNPEKAEELKADREAGLKITEIMEKYQLSKKTVYRYLSR